LLLAIGDANYCAKGAHQKSAAAPNQGKSDFFIPASGF